MTKVTYEKEELFFMSCCRKKSEETPKSSCCKSHKAEGHTHDENASSCCSSREGRSGGCCSSKKQKAKQEVIHRQMTIEDILSLFPNKAQKLSATITEAGLHCVGCQAAVFETLEGGMALHGKSEEEIDTLVTKLNALLQEKIDLSSIHLTESAAKKFLEILQEEGRNGVALRFSVEPMGCSGFEYVLDFSEERQDHDVVFSSHGVEIHVEESKVPSLLGTEIDYVEGARGSGFKITNPNENASCGSCGCG